MRSAEKFKIGFLRKMAESGLRPSDFENVGKTAAISDFANLLTGGTLALGKAGLTLGLAAPLAAGTVGGMGARVASQADDEDVDEVKDQEMADTYRRLARDIRERTRKAQQRRGYSLH